MTSPAIRLISECFVKPLHNLSSDKTKQPIHFTPFDLLFLNVNYSQKGLLFTKPENTDFSITAFLDDLKHSLSATLTHFYPLAGRLATRKQDNPPSYVIYLDPENSPGVKFIYAKTDATVSDVLYPVDVPLIVHSFFDLNNAINHDGHTLPLLSIQVTELTDGIFIGGSINHVVADGTSYWHFMTSWSEIFRSMKEKSCYLISRSPVFKRTPIEGCDPIINLPYTHHNQFIERFKYPQVKERFFHFSSSSISKLKEKANSECNTNKISSLQALSALLWRCITRVRHPNKETTTTCKLAVSNRNRLNPPLPADYFGNPVQLVGPTTTVNQLMSNGLGWAAMQLHEAVNNHDDKSVKKWIESWSRNPSIIKMSRLFDPNAISIGSSPRFNMYGCEFGMLGKPVATRSGCSNKADGKITMFPGHDGGGSMTVEVCLLPIYMMDIEHDEEFMNALRIK